ncbi:hypothetical protein HAX54_015414, partial [Datura stramonium]|nr:hypothetical protein [Datura stramonium]
MESNANKGKDIEVVGKGLKRLQKGTKGSSPSATGAPARRFGERGVNLMDFHASTQKRMSNMLLRIGLTKGASHLSSPPFGTRS